MHSKYSQETWGDSWILARHSGDTLVNVLQAEYGGKNALLVSLPLPSLFSEGCSPPQRSPDRANEPKKPISNFIPAFLRQGDTGSHPKSDIPTLGLWMGSQNIHEDCWIQLLSLHRKTQRIPPCAWSGFPSVYWALEGFVCSILVSIGCMEGHEVSLPWWTS